MNQKVFVTNVFPMGDRFVILGLDSCGYNVMLNLKSYSGEEVLRVRYLKRHRSELLGIQLNRAKEIILEDPLWVNRYKYGFI